MPTAAAARARTGANSRSPPERSPSPPGLRHGMRRVEDDRVAGPRHDRHSTHIDDERIVSEARAALAQQNPLVAGRGDLRGGVLHVPRRQELTFFDVDRLAGRACRQQQVGLAAEKRRNLQNIDDFGHRSALLLFVHIGQHRKPGNFPHLRKDRQTRFQPNASLRAKGRAVGLVERGLVDERRSRA